MTKHKAGFVSILGSPNVGKSTLMNALVGERLSIITSKAQTTRHRILGIVNGEDFQVVFSDTPGILKPNYDLQTHMMQFVKTALEDADLFLYMVEWGEREIRDETVHHKLLHTKVPVFLIINKIDTANEQTLAEATTYWQDQLPKASVFAIAALENFGVEALFSQILKCLPESPPYYPKDQLTDRPERFFVNEIVREKILLNYKKEIPYAVEIVTESFEETDTLLRIRVVIMVERETQKGILIGHKGAPLKRVGIAARQDMERFFGKKVHLEQYVKVNKNWRNNATQLKRFGYNLK